MTNHVVEHRQLKTHTILLTVVMTSGEVVSRASRDYSVSDDPTRQTTETPGFKLLTNSLNPGVVLIL